MRRTLFFVALSALLTAGFPLLTLSASASTTMPYLATLARVPQAGNAGEAGPDVLFDLVPPIDVTEDLLLHVPMGADLGTASDPGTDPAVEAALVAQDGPKEQLPQVYSHTVVEGDTLWDIAEQFGVSLDTVIGANPDINPNTLKVGQVIKVLSVDGVLHTVKSGDTVSALAAKYKVDQAVILRANALSDPNQLQPGQQLIIPGATPVIVHKVTLSSGGSTTVSAKFRRPVDGGFISSGYGWRSGSFHQGIDIAVPYSRSIYASRSGKVIFAGWRGGYGNAVIISHGDGITTLYGHVSKLLVSYGQWVDAGQVIARVGSTGNSTGPHVHFEIRINGSTVNPRDLIEP